MSRFHSVVSLAQDERAETIGRMRQLLDQAEDRALTDTERRQWEAFRLWGDHLSSLIDVLRDSAHD